MMKVFVYWNLHKNLWSIKALEGPNKGRVIDRVPEVKLINCIFKVYEKGRDRVRREQRKNVHAGVIGYITDENLYGNYVSVYYNPYKTDTFINRNTKEPMYESEFVIMNPDRSVHALV